MTQLQPVSIGKKNRSRKAHLKIDLTPLVDLGFLLITFFIFTTTMGEPHKTELFMPAGDVYSGSVIGKTNALTVLLPEMTASIIIMENGRTPGRRMKYMLRIITWLQALALSSGKNKMRLERNEMNCC